MMNKSVNKLHVVPSTIRNTNGFILKKKKEIDYGELLTTLNATGYECYYIEKIDDRYMKISTEKPFCEYDLFGWYFTKDRINFKDKKEIRLCPSNAKYYLYFKGELEITVNYSRARAHSVLDIRKITFEEYCKSYDSIFAETCKPDTYDDEDTAIINEGLHYRYTCIPAKIYNCEGVVIRTNRNRIRKKDKLIIMNNLRHLGFNIYYLKHQMTKDAYDDSELESIWYEPVNGNNFGWFVTKDAMDFSNEKYKKLSGKNAVYYGNLNNHYDSYTSYFDAEIDTIKGITIDEFVCYSKYYDMSVNWMDLADIVKCKVMSVFNHSGIVIKADKNLKNRARQYLLMRELYSSYMTWYTLCYVDKEEEVPSIIMYVPSGNRIFGWFLSVNGHPYDIKKAIKSDHFSLDNVKFNLDDKTTKLFKINEDGHIKVLPFSKYKKCKKYPVSYALSNIITERNDKRW